MLDVKIKELIAIGASVSANCSPCIRFHLDKAKKLNIDAEDIRAALQVGVMVRGGAAGQMDELLSEMSKKYTLDYHVQCDKKQTCE
ncbi:MAG: carboxymuconolactone decarboxylase family protein [Planctomycetota bacterium]|jgi:AhpD family alkylhydroperoxidase